MRNLVHLVLEQTSAGTLDIALVRCAPRMAHFLMRFSFGSPAPFRKAVMDTVRSTLGPRGMDKLIFDGQKVTDNAHGTPPQCRHP